jgi:predicted metal-binding membrane protein
LTTAAAYRSREAAVLLAVAAAAWLVVIAQARSGMGAMSAAAGFAVAWTTMMAAMMLPSVAPVAALYSRSIAGSRRRLAEFTIGYVGVWAATAVPAFLIANIGAAAAMRFGIARPIAVAAFLLVAVYQLSRLKTLCLEKCRSPLSLFLEYASYRGAARDVRAGAHHAAYCLGCCWPLMLLLIVVGMMNLAVVVLIAAFVVVEKNFTTGQIVSRLAAVVAASLGVAAMFVPQLGVGLVS